MIALPGTHPFSSPPGRSVPDGVWRVLSFMIFPDEPTAQRIAALVRHLRLRHGLSGRPLATDRFHISMYGLAAWQDEPPPSLLEGAIAAASSLEFRPFAVQLDVAKSFKGAPEHRPFVLGGGEGVVGLEFLRDQIDEAMARRTGVRAARSFTPHLTLLYDPVLVEEHPVEPIRWTVRELVLVESLRGQSRYIRRGVWRLG